MANRQRTRLRSLASRTTQRDMKLRALRTAADLLSVPIDLLGRVRSYLHFDIRQRTFRPRPDDLFIVTYPRSGTTWMQMLCHQLRTGGDLGFRHIGEVSPFFEQLREPSELAILESLPSPRSIKTHYPLDMLPASKCVYIARNVREVIGSCFHHARLLHRYRGTWEEFADEFFTDGYGLPEWGTWFDHVRLALERRGDPNLLFLTFDEMRLDLDNVARRVAAFWGISVSADRWGVILERCTREAMRAKQDRFDPRLDPLGVTGLRDFIGKEPDPMRLPPDKVALLEQLLSDSIWKDTQLGSTHQ